MDFERECKNLITDGQLEALQEKYRDFLEDYDVKQSSWQYVYVQLYTHACLKKQTAIADWLKSLYEDFSTVDKIALRQCFAYGNYLMRH